MAEIQIIRSTGAVVVVTETDFDALLAQAEKVSALTIEVETARNAAKDIARETERLRSDLTACHLERDRLRAGLLGHACVCGPTDPDPSVHREDCPYRKWASPDPQ